MNSFSRGLLIATSLGACCLAQTRDEVLAAMHKAAAFYSEKVATEGGYHYYYTDDLAFGRSEHSEGRTMSENQREATPLAGMTYLEAWDATQDRFYLEAARQTGLGLVKGQHCSGGWDYVIEFDPAKRAKYPYRVDNNCGVALKPADAQTWTQPYTTLDDNTTQACLRFLMRLDQALAFKDNAIHGAALYALEKLAAAQYPNGAWPQRYYQPPDASKFPVRKASYPTTWSRKWPGPNYQDLYTLNDNVMSDMIDTYLEAARIYNEPRYRTVAAKGGDFLLLAQMPDPQPAWAQQYNLEMHPAWARAFEPPSVTGGESQGVMKILLVLYQETGNRKYLEAVAPALKYLQQSELPPANHPVEARSKIPTGAPVLARFYELQTNKPLYMTKGTRVWVSERPVTNLDGYQISYSDESVIRHYNVLVSGASLARIGGEYKRLSGVRPEALRRPGHLHGLSPWAEYEGVGTSAAQFPSRSTQDGPIGSHPIADRPQQASGEQVRQIIAKMDSRGAWVEDGSIGKADRVVGVLAAKDMVVKIGKKTYTLKEDEMLEVFRGPEPPKERIISTAAFAQNMETLISWLKR